jgi:transmembrane sensor
VVAVAVAFNAFYGVRLGAYAYTPIGQTRTVQLPDGSTVILNTDSAIAVHFSAAQREVELLRGEADFQVTPDPTRPFVVEAAGGWTRALGTEFVVRLVSDGATVTGIVHSVSVGYERATARMHPPITLEPGERAWYSRAAGLQPLAPVELEFTDAWRKGWLTFEDRPLGEVVEELNRYHPGVIRVTDAKLRQLRVTCVVPLNNPIAVIESLKQTLGLKTTQLTDYLIFIHG